MIHHNHELLRENASLIMVVQQLLDPTISVVLLVICASMFGIHFQAPHQLLAVTTFLLMLPIFKAIGMYHRYRSLSPSLLGLRLLMGWSVLVGILLFIGFSTKTSALFSRVLLLTWVACVPCVLLGMHLIIWQFMRQIRLLGRNTRFAVIAGVNPLSLKLAKHIHTCKELGLQLNGFFDDKPSVDASEAPILGSLSQLPKYVQQHQIDVVYIACSTENEASVRGVIEALQDTTACVYFVPNLLMSHLIHSRSYELNGIPLISIWEIPFSDLQYRVKRAIDIVIAMLALVVLSPIMLIIAVTIKLSSPGPIVFKQRRYGLNGQEIIVYKFRSMTVMEDGDTVPQAKRCDNRVTKVGAVLRKTSLDELPQFINVLQGRMSIVGPRPHAVAHNEMYRKLINGYMLRHKVKPGITGWAQVNGHRGETDTLDKMQQRVNYDLEYLKNWSLNLDLQIIFKTAFVFLKDQNAY